MLMNPVQMFTMSVHMFREEDIGYYGYWALRTGDIVAGGIGH